MEDPQVTPILGFQFFWHARHDQGVTAPGRIACRHCRPSRRAGEWPASMCTHSQLAAVATVVAGASQPAERRSIRGQGDLVFRELFAGKGVLTQEWLKQGGHALEPVEVYEHPHAKRGYQARHDLCDAAVQTQHLHRAKHGPENVAWIASPCTSYCDWNIENGGSRTFAHPEGGHERPLTATEEQGNVLSEFGATYFETMLDAGGFPIVESSGVSGRYPKQWDLPAWKRVLQRPDVDYVDFPMCAFGLGPPDEENAFYRHNTRVVFPKHPPLKAALTRRCPGQGPNHRHIGLKGSRPGCPVTRCTEAGVYAKQFVDVVVTILRDTLVGGGRSPSTEVKG